MFSTTTTLTAAALLAALGLAAPARRQEPTQPAPTAFNMTITSCCDGKYLNTYVEAVHIGPGFDGIVPTSSTPYAPFYFNGTDYEFTPGYTQPGYIQYYVPAEPSAVSRQAYLYGNTEGSNVLSMQFGPGSQTPAVFSFSTAGELAAYDDGYPTSSSAASYDSKFYICPTEYLGDTYDLLSYVDGGATPDNTACEAVTVQKVT